MTARQTAAQRHSNSFVLGMATLVAPAPRKAGVRTWLLSPSPQVALLLWLCCAQGSVALGQNEGGTAEPVAQSVPKVVSLRTSVKDEPTSAGLDDMIYVKVENLDALLEQSPIQLYLNGRPAPVSEPQVLRGEKGSGELGFRLAVGKSEADHEYWMEILPPLAFTKEVVVTVGPASGAIDGQVSLTLIVMREAFFWLWLLLFLFLVLIVFYLGKNTKMLRDSGPPGATGGKWNRYSLSRTQMAFWFVLIVGSFGFIWLVTGQTDTLTSSVVALAGISAATALGAATVDAGKENAAAMALAESLPQQQSLETSVKSSIAARKQNQTAAVDTATTQQEAEQQSKLALVNAKVAALSKQATVPPSQCCWLDILSDANGISLHRLQIFIWTIVLGFIFVEQVYVSLSMPQFSSTLLALMGVSSGTYVGFKFPEQKQ